MSHLLFSLLRIPRYFTASTSACASPGTGLRNLHATFALPGKEAQDAFSKRGGLLHINQYTIILTISISKQLAQLRSESVVELETHRQLPLSCQGTNFANGSQVEPGVWRVPCCPRLRKMQASPLATQNLCQDGLEQGFYGLLAPQQLLQSQAVSNLSLFRQIFQVSGLQGLPLRKDHNTLHEAYDKRPALTWHLCHSAHFPLPLDILLFGAPQTNMKVQRNLTKKTACHKRGVDDVPVFHLSFGFGADLETSGTKPSLLKPDL